MYSLWYASKAFETPPKTTFMLFCPNNNKNPNIKRENTLYFSKRTYNLLIGKFQMFLTCIARIILASNMMS